MADDDLQVFDLSMKKKKKKKVFDPDALLEKVSDPDPVEEPETTNSSSKMDDGAVDIDDFDFTKMKKKPKKKKKDFDLSELSAAVDSVDTGEDGDSPRVETAPGDARTDVTDADKADDDLDGLDINFGGEKKKKKKKAKFDSLISDKPGDGSSEDSKDWVDSGKDYTYDELLKRVFDIMREKNPEMVAGEKKRLIMKPPQVVKIGAKKTSFVNFTEICKSLHRQPKHLLAFLMAELGTSGSIDGNNQLIIKGRFQPKQIENVLRNYIKEYVSCHTCKSPDTILQKDTRLYFLQCETCRSRCSVSSIKSGFQAVTGKRAAIRAKTT